MRVSNLAQIEDAVKAQAVRDALRQTNNSVAEAAGLLGVHKATLYRLMSKYGIEIRRIVA